MSIKLMSECWTRQIPRSEREVLLVFCDHANDDGYNARPSIARIAWKTDISDRHIKRIVQALIQKTALRITRDSSHDQPRSYRVVLTVYPPKPAFQTKRERGDTMSPQQMELGVTLPTGGVTDLADRGDIAVSPKPSNQPSVPEPPASSFSCAPGAQNVDDEGDLPQRIRQFLSERGINEPVLSELAQKFATLKDGFLWLIMEYGRCTDESKYKHKTHAERVSMFINRARTKWLADSLYQKSALP